jgi:glucosyl-dolichyl phosphate glucuronosyltransferase
MSASPLISVVIATYRREELVQDCIRSVHKQSYRHWEALVIDQDADQPLKEKLAREFPDEERIRYIYVEKAGLAHAKNIGIEQSQGRIVAFIDDDALADPLWLEGIVETFAKYPELGMVAGRIIPIWVSGRPEWYPKEREVLLGLYDLGDSVCSLPPYDLPIGANMAGARDKLVQAGGFDKEFGYNYFRKQPKIAGEDSMLSERMIRSGWPVYYQPKALVRHRIEPRKLSRKAFLERHYWEGYTVVRRLEVLNEIRPPAVNHYRFHLREAAMAIGRFCLPKYPKGPSHPAPVVRMLALSRLAYSCGTLRALRDVFSRRSTE